MLIAIGATLFVGQFALLFPAMAVGMPPGLASIALQVQAFITIAIAAVVLRERPTRAADRRRGGRVRRPRRRRHDGRRERRHASPASSLLLGAAVSWAIGNVLLRRAGAVDMLSLMSWLSLVAPIRRSSCCRSSSRDRRASARRLRRRELADRRRAPLHRVRLDDLRLCRLGPSPEALPGGDRRAILAARAGLRHAVGGAAPRRDRSGRCASPAWG